MMVVIVGVVVAAAATETVCVFYHMGFSPFSSYLLLQCCLSLSLVRLHNEIDFIQYFLQLDTKSTRVYCSAKCYVNSDYGVLFLLLSLVETKLTQ